MTDEETQITGGNVRGGKSEEKHKKEAQSYEDYLQVRQMYSFCHRCNIM